jgi:glycine dehydrogenase subunit 2
MWLHPEPLLFEKSAPGRTGSSAPALDVPPTPFPAELVRGEVKLPELSELEVVRHYTRLST